MPLTYKLDEEWCKKILEDPQEISVDDLEWVREACKNFYHDVEISGLETPQ